MSLFEFNYFITMDYYLYAITKSGFTRDITQYTKIHSVEILNTLIINILDAYANQTETDILPKYAVIYFSTIQLNKDYVSSESWKLWDTLQFHIQQNLPEALLFHKLLNGKYNKEDILFARKVIDVIIKHEFGYQNDSDHTLYELEISTSSASAIVNKLAECDAVIAKTNITSILSTIISKMSQSNDKYVISTEYLPLALPKRCS
jgi:hypothetical protein